MAWIDDIWCAFDFLQDMSNEDLSKICPTVLVSIIVAEKRMDDEIL